MWQQARWLSSQNLSLTVENMIHFAISATRR
jgi:hypothetical protein